MLSLLSFWSFCLEKWQAVRLYFISIHFLAASHYWLGYLAQLLCFFSTKPADVARCFWGDLIFFTTKVARALPSGRPKAARCLGTALSTALVLGCGLTLLHFGEDSSASSDLKLLDKKSDKSYDPKGPKGLDVWKSKFRSKISKPGKIYVHILESSNEAVTKQECRLMFDPNVLEGNKFWASQIPRSQHCEVSIGYTSSLESLGCGARAQVRGKLSISKTSFTWN